MMCKDIPFCITLKKYETLQFFKTHVHFTDILTSIDELFDTKYNKQGLRRADRAISEQMDRLVSDVFKL